MKNKLATIVFTGTRAGMTPEQRATVVRFLNDARPTLVAHGKAKGADKEFHAIVDAVQLRIRVMTFPAKKDPLARNRRMVATMGPQGVLATPRTFQEERRSGTWATIRYGLSQGIPAYIIWPDGKLQVVTRRSSPSGRVII